MLGFIQLFERADVDDEGHDESGAVPHQALPRYLTVGRAQGDAGTSLILVLIGHSAITVPVRVGFRRAPRDLLWALEVGMSLVFMTDLVLSFFTPYLDTSDGLWVRRPAQIAKELLERLVLIDAPSSVLVELIEGLCRQRRAGRPRRPARPAHVPGLFRLLRPLSRRICTSPSWRTTSRSTCGRSS